VFIEDAQRRDGVFDDVAAERVERFGAVELNRVRYTRRDAAAEVSVLTVMIPICPLISNLMSVYWWSAMTTVALMGLLLFVSYCARSSNSSIFNGMLRFIIYDTSESQEEKKHGGPGNDMELTMISAPAAAAAPQNDVPQPRFDGMWGESGT
jgi:hypothetical protein